VLIAIRSLGAVMIKCHPATLQPVFFAIAGIGSPKKSKLGADEGIHSGTAFQVLMIASHLQKARRVWVDGVADA